jgi:hypothetical protein
MEGPALRTRTAAANRRARSRRKQPPRDPLSPASAGGAGSRTGGRRGRKRRGRRCSEPTRARTHPRCPEPALWVCSYVRLCDYVFFHTYITVYGTYSQQVELYLFTIPTARPRSVALSTSPGGWPAMGNTCLIDKGQVGFENDVEVMAYKQESPPSRGFGANSCQPWSILTLISRILSRRLVVVWTCQHNI